MEKDRYAVIWTQINGDPVKMANIISTGREFRFSYTQDYLNTGSTTGVSIFSSPDIFEDKPIVHTASEAMPLYPRLMSLIPGQGKKNIQRRIYNNILAKYDTPPAPGFDTEWALLMMAGRNGIGHIDIFETDFEAQQWYEEKQKPLLQSDESELRSTIWQFLKEDLSMALPEDIDLVNLLGPTPSVGGMIPKILATIPDLPKSLSFKSFKLLITLAPVAKANFFISDCLTLRTA